MTLSLSSIASPLANHLWQSTVFAAAVWMLTLLLRRHSANIRFALWLAASLKFLLPFSLLVGLGAMFPRPHQVIAPAAVYAAIDTVGEPFSFLPSPPMAHTAQRLTENLPIVLAVVWCCGLLLVLAIWLSRWRRIRSVLRHAATLHEGREFDSLRRLSQRQNAAAPLSIRQSPQMMEPGIVGIFRPNLLWPAGLSDHLDDQHLEAILAHELLHVARRDNLTATLHMAVVSLFWFHPIVWWIERRMVEEREIACDEAVVRIGCLPGTYAESLLKACRFCVESPLPCVAGITGADLNRRVRSIMIRRSRQLTFAGRLGLVFSSVLIVIAPLAYGVVRIVPVFGQILHASGPGPSFEVATIKPAAPFMLQMNAPPHGEKAISEMVISSGPASPAPGSSDIVQLKTPAAILIAMAYNLPVPSKGRIIGGPDWINKDLYDIQARIPDALYAAMRKMPPAQSREQRMLMEQSLLADRFKLAIHFETRELPTYALMLDKGNSKIPAAKAGETTNLSVYGDGQAEELKATATTIETMTRILQMQPDVEGRLLVDQTGLAGKYDINLKWTRDRPSADSASAQTADSPAFFTALREQLGLRLVPSKSQVEVIVIDHVERPSEN